MNTAQEIQTLAAPQEFTEEVFNGIQVDPVIPQIVHEQRSDPRVIRITEQAPVRIVQHRTGGGRIIPIAIPDKGQSFCLPEQEFKIHALNCAVSTRNIQRGTEWVEVLGKVTVTDKAGKVIARFTDPAQALAYFKRIKFDHDRLYNGARLLEPAEKPGTPPPTRRARQASEDKLLKLVSELAASNKQSMETLILALTASFEKLALAQSGKAPADAAKAAVEAATTKKSKKEELQAKAEQIIAEADAANKR